VTGPAPSGPLPILLLHGALGARDQLAPLAAALAEVVDAPVQALEFAGHGSTPPDPADAGGYAIERLSAQVARALADHGGGHHRVCSFLGRCAAGPAIANHAACMS